ncbi:hypothetical protein GY14_14410 [Delftia tsuruhatensis]|nr:hypothetical protein GY14_14410 [Delftia tsuruhatensis]
MRARPGRGAYKGLALQVGGADAALGRQPVRCGQQRHQFVFHQGHGLEALVGQHDEADLHAPLQQPLDHGVVILLVDLHQHGGLAAAVFGDQRGQQTQRGRGAERGHAQRAARHAALGIGLLPQGLLLLEDVVGALQQPRACVGQRGVGAFAAHQLHLQLAFQRAQGMADGALGNAQQRGRARETAGAGQRREHFELGEGHGITVSRS